MRRRIVQPQNPIRIMWISDIHLKHEVDGDPEAEGAQSGQKYYWDASRRLQVAVDWANANKPDLVIAAGDLIEDYQPENIALWNSVWSGLDAEIPQIITLGNHEFYNGGTYDDLVTDFGDGDGPNAGSVFNRSTVIEAYRHRVLVVVADSNILSVSGGSHVHGETNKGRLFDDAIEWVEGLIEDSGVDVVVFATHHGFNISPQFEEAHVQAFVSMVEALAEDRPRLRVYHLFGHLHGARNAETWHPQYWRYTGGRVQGFRCPALVEFRVGAFAEACVGESIEVRSMLV